MFRAVSGNNPLNKKPPPSLQKNLYARENLPPLPPSHPPPPPPNECFLVCKIVI